MTTRPHTLTGSLALSELLDAAGLDEALRSFADFHGVQIALLDMSGRALRTAGESPMLCGVARETAPGRERCDRMRGTLGGLDGRGECFSGQRYASAPLIVEGEMLGTLLLGPYRPAERAAEPTASLLAVLSEGGMPRATSATRNATALDEPRVVRLLAHLDAVIERLLGSALARHRAARAHLHAVEEAYAALANKTDDLARLVHRLEEVDRLKTAFLCNVSHELRTPLTSVIGYAEMLLEGLGGALTGEQRDYVRVIMDKGDDLLTLISAVMDVARLEAGDLTLVREPVDVGEVIDHVFAELREAAKKKGLDVDLRRSGAPRVLADRQRLSQVMQNLIGNAIKFTAKGKVEVAVEPPTVDKQVRLIVRDTGIGISKDVQGQIFEAFYQVDSSSTRAYGGTGLGLALVKQLVEAHGGTVSVESDLGRGSCFVVALPAIDE